MAPRFMRAWWKRGCRARKPPLEISRHNAYICLVTSVTMAINTARNKRCGPGGGTRRLHQSPALSAAVGGETGSTRVVKGTLLLGIVPPLSG